MRSFLALSILTSITLAHWEPALACSGVSCSEGDLLPKDAKVPANVLAWMWRPSSGEPWAEGEDAGAAEPSVRVFIEGDAGAELSLESTELDWNSVRLTPTVAPEPGTTLRVEYTDTCPVRTEIFNVEVIAPLPIPASLGELDHSLQSGYVNISDGSAGCSEGYYARYVDAVLNPDPQLAQFGAVVSYAILVDGERFDSEEVVEDQEDDDDDVVPRTFAAGPWGAGRERVFALCDDGNGQWPGSGGDVEGEGVTPGLHRIQMLGLLADGTRILSDEIEVDLSCTECGVDGGVTSCADAGAPDSGVTPVVEGGATTEPTDTDGPSDTDEPIDTDGPTDTDASAPNAPEGDAGAAVPTVKPVSESASDDDGGCSYALNGRGAHPLSLGLGLLAMVVGSRLRRRRSLQA